MINSLSFGQINSITNKGIISIELFLDNSIAYRAQIVNGEKIKEVVFNETTNNKTYPCTLAGIRQCAVDRIHAQNGIDMWTCIAEGIDCVIMKYASCMVDNC